jgi:steroid delta-isomerase-like uncharacterized protein/uncharacterized protein (TIGR02246 family)
MKTTFAVVAAMGLVSMVCGCDEDKKAPEPAQSATTAPATPPATTAAASAQPKASPAELAHKTMKAVVEAWNAHDATKVAALYEPQGKLVIAGLPDFAGRDAIAGEAKDTFAGYSDFKVGVTRTFAHGNTVAIEWVITGKNDGPFMGQKASARPMGVAGASVVTFDDEGLIKEDHRYFDMPTLQSQLDPKAKAGTFRTAMTMPAGAPEEHVAKGTPDETKNADKAKQMYASFRADKIAEMMAFVADDAVMEDFTSPAQVKGNKAIQDAMTPIWKAFPDMAATTPVAFGADDWVVVETNIKATHKGPLGPIKASNKPVNVHGVDILQMKDGKIARYESYSNNAELLVQIGAMPPMGATPAGATTAVASTSPTPPVKTT